MEKINKKTGKIDEELINFIKRVKKEINIKCIILFGSRARGDFTKSSDFDLIIVGEFEENFLKRPLYLIKLNQSSYNFELFCYTKEEFKKLFNQGNTLILDALDEGIPLIGKNFFNTYKKGFNIMKQQGLKRSSCTWILP